ncbi:hypothetical protein FFLO_06828 [Filobasidium floriforme]|uniref:Chitobiosyldiphosphodolichol beta-mannosyltransferase n=1 Tax=Filobasidium floriforme TaxID=5210 RepID=A0A8K0JEM8_9TREE|nr:putative beta-1,4-mannosyltransferase [Filobasidium floriforme]KAG7527547.1 hypothetical protein FFLO_06828 [Filobasidium floriforme]KAH8080574.1 putative beta-1,4-mannosyltransferase [Filobasidium floriforme]
MLTGLLLLLFIAVIPFLCVSSYLYLAWTNPRSLFASAKRKTAVVLVLGDVGRSPRMMYHTESLAKLGWETSLIGYRGSTPLASLMTLPHVHLAYLPDPPFLVRKLPFVLAAPIKIAWQSISVLALLLKIRAEVVMVQNPPSIPTLLLAQIAAHLRGSRLIIDWHNTGHSILALKLGSSSPLVAIATWFERTFGKVAFAHLFVTEAMKVHLAKEWQLSGKKIVLHDRPPANFRRCGPMTAHELFGRVIPDLDPPFPCSFLPKTGLSTRTQIFTRMVETSQETIALDPERPALIVSSTSWTPDEDFAVLLDGLSLYERQAKSTASGLPRLVVLVSGKGPLLSTFKKLYAERIEKETWSRVVVRTVWLEIEDYPRFLGCADLGISLHQSSSGLDLPMKVVDMFGCGVPVLARGFRCVGELVKHNQNGMVFDTAQDLAEQLISVLVGFPVAKKLDKLRAFFPGDHTPDLPGAHTYNRHEVDDHIDPSATSEWSTWDEEWTRMVAPVISDRSR